MADESHVYVLFGSQTGNSEFIANDIHMKLTEHGISAKCLPLNSAHSLKLKSLATAIIVIISTTGNGDCPENADKWWRSIKLRSAEKDMFENLPFLVLGLGDTNYDKFCHMGKCVDKRLGELGGKRLLNLCCADEATGLEETVEKWKLSTLTITKTICSISSVEKVERNECMNHIVDSKEFDPINQICEQTAAISLHQCDSYVQTSLPNGVMNCNEIVDFLNISDHMKSSPQANTLPRSKPVASTVVFPTIRPEILPISKLISRFYANEWTVENPFESTILSAQYLTTKDTSVCEGWGEDRTVIKLELCLANSGIDYQPGDSIGICCPNPEYHVNIVFQRLKAYYAASSHDISLASDVHDKTSNTYLTLQDLLRYRYDLTSIPKKSAVLTLSKSCTNEKDAIFMQWLCSKADIGKRLWTHFIEEQRLGMAELLELVPSCCPSLDTLLDCLSPLPPRFYSIASSPLVHIASVVIAFSVVKYTCRVQSSSSDKKPSDIRRYGVCTTYLEELAQPLINDPLCASRLKLKIFHKTTINFHLPGSPAHPLILIGPGTGVAPFIGFLEQREQIGLTRTRSNDEMSTGVWRGGFEMANLPCESSYVGQYIESVGSGPIHLYFGCRGPHDFLFKNYLEAKVADGVLTSLSVAMSRISAEKIYVTAKILERGSEICQLLLNQGAYVYICGDGNDMAKDVNNAIKSILVEYGSMSSKEAQDFIDDLRHRRRYLLDIWS